MLLYLVFVFIFNSENDIFRDILKEDYGSCGFIDGYNFFREDFVEVLSSIYRMLLCSYRVNYIVICVVKYLKLLISKFGKFIRRVCC